MINAQQLTRALSALGRVRLPNTRHVPTPNSRDQPGPYAVGPNPPVWVVYCEEIPERRPVTETHLAERGVTAHWWRSVHAKTWQINGRQSPGMIGCHLGHWSLWNHLHHIGVEEALILEDDVVLCPDFLNHLHRLRTWIPPDRGLVMVGVIQNEYRVRQLRTHLFEDGTARMTDPYGTHCYLVRRPALPILLDHMRDSREAVDVILYRNVLGPGLVNWSVCSPALATQRTQGGGDWPSSAGG